MNDDLDPKALGAAKAALCKAVGWDGDDYAEGDPWAVPVAAVIRAYEAYKASAVPCEVREVVHWLRHGDSENASEWERRAADLLMKQERVIAILEEELKGLARERMTEKGDDGGSDPRVQE